MRRSTPTTRGLKLVMLFDRRNQTCCVCSHNLDAEDASQEVTELRRDGLLAFTVDQRTRHTEADPDECAACRAESKHSITPLPACKDRKWRFCRSSPLETKNRSGLVPLRFPEKPNLQILEVCHVE